MRGTLAAVALVVMVMMVVGSLLAAGESSSQSRTRVTIYEQPARYWACRDDEGYVVRTPDGRRELWGVAATWNDLQTIYGWTGPVSTAERNGKCLHERAVEGLR